MGLTGVARNATLADNQAALQQVLPQDVDDARVFQQPQHTGERPLPMRTRRSVASADWRWAVSRTLLQPRSIVQA